MKTRARLFLLATVLMTSALLSAARPAASRCLHGLCWEVDANTVCCYGEDDCTVTCWP